MSMQAPIKLTQVPNQSDLYLVNLFCGLCDSNDEIVLEVTDDEKSVMRGSFAAMEVPVICDCCDGEVYINLAMMNNAMYEVDEVYSSDDIAEYIEELNEKEFAASLGV